MSAQSTNHPLAVDNRQRAQWPGRPALKRVRRRGLGIPFWSNAAMHSPLLRWVNLPPSFAQETFCLMRLTLDVAVCIGQPVEAGGAFRRHATYGIRPALVPALLDLLNHGALQPLYSAPEKLFFNNGLFDVQN